MKPSTSAINFEPSSSEASVNGFRGSASYFNDCLPLPDDEPVISDSRFLDASIDEMRKKADCAEKNFKERNAALIAEGRSTRAQLYQRYMEEEERKRNEQNKNKEVFQVSMTPMARNQDRKRRVACMEEEWSKRGHVAQWMGQQYPIHPPQHHASYHQHHQHQQYVMMQQQQQQQQQQLAAQQQQMAACVNIPSTSNSAELSPANAPIQGGQVLESGSPSTLLNNDLSDLPTPKNVDYLAQSEFRCANVIKDLGPDCFDEFFSEIEPSSSSSVVGNEGICEAPSSTPTQNIQSPQPAASLQSNGNTNPLGPPMFSSTPVPSTFSANSDVQQMQQKQQQHAAMLKQQQQIQMQQQQQQMMMRQQHHEMLMKQQGMYHGGYRQMMNPAAQSQQFYHQMRMQQPEMRYGPNGMMDPRLMAGYNVAPGYHPTAHSQPPMYPQHPQFAHPMN